MTQTAACSLLLLLAFSSTLFAQADGLKSKTTYAKAYGETKNPVAVDPGKDLPRYPAVEPKDAIATWQVKKGFKLQLAANEPQVRDPIAVSFDENGRMFVCEMHDYSEMRDVTPHMGRVSMLEDKDGDGHFETSQVFADDLAWPTGLIYANGGVFVIATPDLWFFKDTDGDGKADVREKVYTGFGTGLKLLNVQGLANSPMWGQDNRIHILAGGGNRGVMTCLKRPELPGIELGGKDFWFDPLTFEFGLEGGGAQYGMSFDNYGRKFGCSNSDHLQYWVYDDKYANRNPYYPMPPARQSIAVDGGAAEVFRISPDEPWRIIRTRWRIAGVVKGAVEGGGRVSGYFTGATGTTIYRGDACGPEFVNNSFTGDAGGQLVHRKIIKPSADGISLIGERPADEHGFEFAASKDTWVRVVNFANAPDGCLHICDMYREVIEHPWSIPDEIKKHIDLNNGNDRGRIYRIVPDKGAERIGQKVALGKASTEELVQTLGHPNGWHRDTAQRLLFERQDKAAVPLLEKALSGENALAKLHALGVLRGLNALSASILSKAIWDKDPYVVEAALHLSETLQPSSLGIDEIAKAIKEQTRSDNMRVHFQIALTVGEFLKDADLFDMSAIKSLGSSRRSMTSSVAQMVLNDLPTNDRVVDAYLSGNPDVSIALVGVIFFDPEGLKKAEPAKLKSISKVIQAAGGAAKAAHQAERDRGGKPNASLLIGLIASTPRAEFIGALAAGFKKAGIDLATADTEHKLTGIFTKAAANAADSKASESTRLEAIQLLGLTSSKEAAEALTQCLAQGQPDSIQSSAIRTLAQSSSPGITKSLIAGWPGFGSKAKEASLEALLAREDRALALLESSVVKPAEFSASQVQALLKHKSPKVAASAKTALASVIPPSREEVTAKFKPAIAAQGDAKKGQLQYMARCVACHRAGTMGLQVGPDLITVKTKGREALLTAILEPHKEIASQYIAYTVNARDGQTLAGIITNDTASSMTLKMMGGLEKTLQRSEIKGSSSTGQSLMPEGLETGMSVSDMADLLSFIEGQ
ncbi:MAG: c-type cytochrome [Prosthecobacter sp.]|uniref:PVC-type heme-binding CxxCH protein n=1 Tax=Prosthecobacter sp. TaxID=1965333 RepID=UPI0025E720D0|nr:PVC-type heme-binding CxxCH protein [Prosthecobacter sp.]MCF7788108.1 c-type cytochrome [Prosthecobacter sp.]